MHKSAGDSLISKQRVYAPPQAAAPAGAEKPQKPKVFAAKPALRPWFCGFAAKLRAQGGDCGGGVPPPHNRRRRFSGSAQRSAWQKALFQPVSLYYKKSACNNHRRRIYLYISLVYKINLADNRKLRSLAAKSVHKTENKRRKGYNSTNCTYCSRNYVHYRP